MRTRTPEELYDHFRRKGDPAALAELFDRVAPELLAVAHHLVRDRAHAEDAVQATFVTAIERAASFEKGRPVLPWLMGVLANKAKELQRAGMRTPDPERLEERAPQEPSAPLEAIELRDAVDKAIRTLPAPYDHVLRLHLSDGLPPAAIASRLDQEAGTVRVQLHRGLALLRRALPVGLTAAATANSAAGATTSQTAALASMREAIVNRAHEAVPGLVASSPLTLSGSLLGGLLMTSKTTLSLVGLTLLAGGVAFVVTRDPEVPVDPALQPAPPAITSAAPLAPPLDQEPEPAVVVDAAPVEAAREAIAADPAQAASTKAPPTALISGRVIDRTTSAPVSGATVELWVTLPGPGNVVATTDGEGRFHFEADGVEARSMRVMSEGYAPYQGVPWYAALNGQPLRPEGEPFEIGDLALDPGVFVAGRLSDWTDRNIAGADLFRFPSLPETSLARGLQPTSEGRTDVSGGFELAELLPYSGSKGYPFVLLSASDSGVAWVELDMLAGEGDSRWFELVEREGATLDVLALNGDRRPVKGALVRLHPTFAPFHTLAPFWDWERNHRIQSFFQGTTDKNGQVRFENLPILEGETSSLYQVQLVYRGKISAIEAATPSIRTENQVELVLHESGAVAVYGKVVDHRGHPIAGASVHPENGGLGSATRTTRWGDFELSLLVRPNETFTLIASSDNHGSRAQEINVGSNGRVASVKFRLHPRHAIAGQVVDDTGEPVPGAYVALLTDGKVSQTLPRHGGHRADEEGRFRFAEADEGTWFLVATPPFQSAGPSKWRGSSRLRVTGGTENVRIVLERREEGQGEVVVELFDHATGAALDAKDVRVVSLEPFFNGDLPQAETVERREGEVLVKGLTHGPWRIWVVTEEHRPAFIDVEIDSEALQRHRLNLGADASLTGRVILPPGEKLRGSPRVTWSLDESHTTPHGPPWQDASEPHGMVDVASDGTFAIQGLAPGPYHVRFHHGYLLADAHPKLSVAEEAELELHCTLGTWVTFSGTDPAEPGFVRLRAWAEDGSWESPVRYMQRKEGVLNAALIVPAGPIEWEVRFRPEGASNREPERMVTGSFQAAASKSIDVRIPSL